MAVRSLPTVRRPGVLKHIATTLVPLQQRSCNDGSEAVLCMDGDSAQPSDRRRELETLDG
jgi:hypothetical protein